MNPTSDTATHRAFPYSLSLQRVRRRQIYIVHMKQGRLGRWDRHLHSAQQKSLLKAGGRARVYVSYAMSLFPPPSSLVCTNFHHGRIWRGFAEERVAMCPSTTQEWRTQAMPIFVASRLRKILFCLVRTLSIFDPTEKIWFSSSLWSCECEKLEYKFTQPHEKVSTFGDK